MICQKCGKQLNDDFQMCPYCGNPVQPAVNNSQFQQNNTYNYGNPQMQQSGSYNYGSQPQYAQAPKQKGTIGTLALVFGIIGVLLSCLYVGIVPAIAAVILGITGITQNKGRGKSIAGLICGVIGVVIVATMLYGSDSSDSDNVVSNQSQYESKAKVETQTESKSESEAEKGPSKKEDKKKEKSDEKSSDKSEKEARKDFIESCQKFDYKKIARNPDDYVGQNFKVTVQVSSISTGSWLTEGYMKAYTDDGSGYYFDNMIYIFDEQDESSSYYVNVLEDDVITVYGTFEGMVDSQNALNGEKSKDIALHMKYAKLVSE